MEEIKAKVAEIFYSLQGEGLYLGYPQLFIRFWGCNIANCRFCDTQGLDYKEHKKEDLFHEVMNYTQPYHSISITGGEPLLQADFLKEFLPLFNKNSKFYLETNGTLPQELEKIISYVDVIAMDIKLPSSTGVKSFWDEHKNFLLTAWDSYVFVKTVIGKQTTIDDLIKAAEIILSVDPHIPLILQPDSNELDEELMDKLLAFQKRTLNFLLNVRIIPQIHKFIAVK
jgi:organic radical activating enzyme